MADRVGALFIELGIFLRRLVTGRHQLAACH